VQHLADLGRARVHAVAARVGRERPAHVGERELRALLGRAAERDRRRSRLVVERDDQRLVERLLRRHQHRRVGDLDLGQCRGPLLLGHALERPAVAHAFVVVAQALAHRAPGIDLLADVERRVHGQPAGQHLVAAEVVHQVAAHLLDEEGARGVALLPVDLGVDQRLGAQ
jgi:hypothetical protein